MQDFSRILPNQFCGTDDEWYDCSNIDSRVPFRCLSNNDWRDYTIISNNDWKDYAIYLNKDWKYYTIYSNNDWTNIFQ